MICALAALAACAGQTKRTTYTCPNGPDLVVTYTGDSAILTFPDDTVEVLPIADPARPDIYAKPGVVWDASRFRQARLTDGPSSFLCDQMAG